MLRRLGNESGQTLITVALGLGVMLGFTALATDVGVLLQERRKAQTAADAAAMAGASQFLTSATGSTLTSNIQAVGQAAAAQNGFTNGTGGATVYVGTPVAGPYAGNSGYVEAVVTQSAPTFFMAVFGTKAMSVSASAVASSGPGDNCIFALGTSGISLSGSNSAAISSPGCGVVDNSNLSVSSSASIVAKSIGVAGSASANSGSINNGGSTSPTPTYGIAPVSDPLAYLTPPSSCSSYTAPPAAGQGGWVSPGSATIGPTSSGGTVCWTGLNIANGMNVTLNPGTYVINGTLSIQGGTTVTGSNVTFYFPNNGDTINIANGTTVTLTAPTTGSLAGILFWQSSADSTGINFAGGSGISLEGVLYAPSASLTMSNNSGTNIYLDLVVNSFTFTGSGTLKSYESLSGAADPFRAITLVE